MISNARPAPNAASWETLVVPLTYDEIMAAVNDDTWQHVRASMHGMSMIERWDILVGWRAAHNMSRKSVVQVANYVNALKRGGMIK